MEKPVTVRAMNTPDAIFFIGRSGAGKGTQAKALAQRLDFFYWEMGAVLRLAAEQDTPLGREIKHAVTNGLFLGDDHIIPIIENCIKEVPAGQSIIFDGTPRRLSQAEYLVGLLHGMGRTNIITLFLDVPREDSVARLLRRAEIEHRADDTEEVITRRLDQFEVETVPVLDYLETVTKFYRLDGRPPIPEVATAINAILES